MNLITEGEIHMRSWSWNTLFPKKDTFLAHLVVSSLVWGQELPVFSKLSKHKEIIWTEKQ